jgi:hypothetical protein
LISSEWFVRPPAFPSTPQHCFVKYIFRLSLVACVCPNRGCSRSCGEGEFDVISAHCVILYDHIHVRDVEAARRRLCRGARPTLRLLDTPVYSEDATLPERRKTADLIVFRGRATPFPPANIPLCRGRVFEVIGECVVKTNR